MPLKTLVDDYGASTSGGNSDTAITNALNSGEAVSGEGRTYYVSGDLNFGSHGRDVHLRDATIIFNGSGQSERGLRLSFTGRQKCVLENVELLTNDGRNGAGLEIEYPASVATNDKWDQMVRLSHVIVGPSGKTNGYFKTGIKLVNVADPVLESLFIRGNPAAGANKWIGSTYGLELAGADGAQPVAIKLDSVSIRNFQYGVYANVGMEGLYLDKCKIVNGEYGVYANFTGPDPLVSVTNSHINAYSRCVDIRDAYECHVKDNVLYRFTENGNDANDWRGVYLNNVKMSQVIGNIFNGAPDGTDGGGTVRPVYLWDCKRNDIFDNRGQGLNRGIDVYSSGTVNHFETRVRDNDWVTDGQAGTPQPIAQVTANTGDCQIATSF